MGVITFLGSRYYATGQSLSDGSVKPFRIAAFLLAAPAVAEDAKKQERFAIDVGSVYAELGAGYRGFMSGGIAFRI